MSLWMKPSIFTGMRQPDHLRRHRAEELELLEKLRAEAAQPERYPHQ